MAFKKPIIKSIAAAAVITTSVSLTGCMTYNPYTGEKQVSDTAKGAGVGALGGAAIGALAGGSKGALIGAGVGTLAGGAVGSYMDKENLALQKELDGTGVKVQKEGSQIKLVMGSDVTFSTNSSDIKPSFYPVLDSVGKVLKKYDNNNVIITGYTDSTGSASYNQQLSEKRAQSVSAYLQGQQVSANRLFAEGKGERDPIASNNTKQGRAENRRVEIVLKPMG